MRELRAISGKSRTRMELPPARYSPELPHPARTHRSYEPSVLINRSRSYNPSQGMRLPISDELLRGHSAASADAVLEAVLRGALSPTQASTTPSFLALMARDLPPAHATRLIEALCAELQRLSASDSSLLASAPRLAEGITVDDDDYSVAVASLATSRAEVKALRAEVKTLRQALLGTHTAAHYPSLSRASQRALMERPMYTVVRTSAEGRRRDGMRPSSPSPAGDLGPPQFTAREAHKTYQAGPGAPGTRGGVGGWTRGRFPVPRPPDKYRPRVGGPTVGVEIYNALHPGGR